MQGRAVPLKLLICGDSDSPEKTSVNKGHQGEVISQFETSQPEIILDLPIPDSLRKILKFNENDETIPGDSTFVMYDDLAVWLKEHREDDSVIQEAHKPPKNLLISEHNPILIVDISCVESYEGPMPSFDILSYLFIYMCCPWIHFLAHAHAAVEPRVADFFNEIVLPNKEFWRKGVVEKKWIKEVRLFCHEDRTLDIVLEPDSDWARDWNCLPEIDFEETDKIRVFKVCLGLNLKTWQGYVVISSVEGASL